MLAIHDRFTPKMCDRLKTTSMGLGLVRLLQDARRFDEARSTLATLESGFQGDELTGCVAPGDFTRVSPMHGETNFVLDRIVDQPLLLR